MPRADNSDPAVDETSQDAVFPDLGPVIEVAPLKRPGAAAQLYGRPGRKGIIVIQEEGGISRRISLSLTAFGVVLALAEQSLRDLLLKPWMPRGFLTTPELKQRLTDYGDRRLSPHYAVRHMHRARKQLAKTMEKVGTLDGMSWAHAFLETNEDLDAYRLSIPPENIYIHPYKLPPG